MLMATARTSGARELEYRRNESEPEGYLMKSHTLRQRENGFTLVELMIVVAIIGIIAVVAYPSYRSYALKSKRSDAISAMAEIAGAQERFYAEKLRYASTVNALPGFTGAPNPYSSNGGFYQIGTGPSATTGFTVTANAQGSQTDDTTCATMTLNGVGVKSPSACF
jgi:type IV pilus assembly protein PilE